MSDDRNISEAAERPVCGHGASIGECEVEGCLYRKEVRDVILGLAGSMAAAGDQAEAMTDAELGQLLVSGRFTTIETHEAGRRLLASARAASLPPKSGSESRRG